MSFLNKRGIQIDDGKLLHETDCVNNYCSPEIFFKWKENNTPYDVRWVETFKHFKENSVPHKNLLLIIQFVFALPGTNAAVERLFRL
jgi:hypothetical protein